ncbi:MAG: ATP-binding protein [Bryobacteraceae bacterium]|jgi:heavy metal sensor kinase
MSKSFRFTLTAWYLALFVALFGLFSFVFYRALSGSLRSQLEQRLFSEADTAVGLFEAELVEANGDVPEAAGDAVKEMRVHGNMVAVLAEGRVLATSDPSRARELESIAPGMRSAPMLLDARAYGTNGALASVRRASAGGREILVVVVEPLDSIARVLETARGFVFIALPLLFAAAMIGGWALTTRGLAPLKWIAEQTRQIGGSSLHRRLDIGNAAEELTVMAASFNELLARLDQSFETMRRFVADASHELRTPLSVIRGEADVALAQERGPAEYKESLAIILDEARRLSRLVDDLLNLARADRGHVTLQVQDFYFNDLLAECCRSVQALAGARGLELECRCPEDAPFSGDEEMLRRLVMNLLDNAIRYTPPGGKISAALEVERSGLRIRISDTGAGIAPEAAPHVFERFYRADKARSRQDGGFGLGLSIVKWIAEAHHGAVELASQPGAGSTFTVTLPR